MSGAAARAFPEPEREIRRRIAAAGSIPFAEFMELALYRAGAGYYAREGARTGLRSGDFATSPDVSPDFGRRLAVQAAEVAERLGGGPWDLVECGAGRGLLAADLADGLFGEAPQAARSLRRVWLVEPGGAHPERTLEERHPELDVRRVRRLEEIPRRSIRGFVVANELLDAMPVHLLQRWGGTLREGHVTEGRSGRLIFVRRPAPSGLVRLARRYRLCRREGWRAEVSTAMEDWLGEIDRILERGVVAVIDYGLEASRLADEAHARGTLVAYRGHRIVLDVLAEPGRQDITAHVNWTHLEDAARERDLVPAGRTTQDRALLALGIAEDLLARPGDSPAVTARRLAARALILPGPGGGKRFQVQLLARGLSGPFRALGDPFAGLARPGR
ncbi:MAG: hypothetical protein D6718_10480 [Acidobacteria bacterium]|nr:MAG: hypothetical protein D6718_10480 [Acidobacteriota bacterium]